MRRGTRHVGTVLAVVAAAAVAAGAALAIGDDWRVSKRAGPGHPSQPRLLDSATGPLFVLPSLKPHGSHVRCIAVTPQDGSVREIGVFGRRARGDLGDLLLTTVEAGDGSATPSGGCRRFRPARTVWAGPLSRFPTTAAPARDRVKLATGQQRVYRIAVDVRPPPLGQEWPGRSVTIDFAWTASLRRMPAPGDGIPPGAGALPPGPAGAPDQNGADHQSGATPGDFAACAAVRPHRRGVAFSSIRPRRSGGTVSGDRVVRGQLVITAPVRMTPSAPLAAWIPSPAARQLRRVTYRLNRGALTVASAPPFAVEIPPASLRPGANLLEAVIERAGAPARRLGVTVHVGLCPSLLSARLGGGALVLRGDFGRAPEQVRFTLPADLGAPPATGSLHVRRTRGEPSTRDQIVGGRRPSPSGTTGEPGISTAPRVRIAGRTVEVSNLAPQTTMVRIRLPYTAGRWRALSARCRRGAVVAETTERGERRSVRLGYRVGCRS